jgi:hypothetical protein
MKKESKNLVPGPGHSQPRRVRLPGWIVQEEVGLGDVIKRVTYAMGIPTCRGCEHRADTLNRWVTFTSGDLNT